MVFKKSFPKTIKGSNYPQWVDVSLTKQEELEQEEFCRKENIKLMEECIEDAKKIVEKNELKHYQTDIISIAKSLFDKRASHSIFWKENKAQEKFDKMNG